MNVTAIGKSQEMTGERVRIEKVRSDEGGYILIMSLFVLVTLFLIGVALAVVGINEFHLSARTKMMDQAYSIAEAGVNQATVELKIKPDLVRETGDGVNNYPNGTPQWQTSDWVDFGGGQFKVQMYQSETPPYNTNPRYKVIKSTGRVNKQQRTAERTIEVRFVAGAANQQYDASFDYLISVFNKDRVDQGLVPYPFPPGGNVADESYTLDGKSQDDATNGSGSMMYPKGCFYARGPIHSYKFFFGNFKILGNIVSTDAIVQYSTFAGLIIPNMQLLIDGNMIAGFDPTVPGGTPFPEGIPYVPPSPTVKMGDISINIGFTGVFNGGFKVGSGSYIAAAKDVTFASLANLNLTSPVEITGGIIAGGNVTCDSAFSINNPLILGNIFCGGETGSGNVLIRHSASLGCTFGNINAKKLDIINAVAFTTGGNIYVSDKFTANTAIAYVKVGEIRAGRGPDNISVDINAPATRLDATSITCTGEAKIALGAIGATQFNVSSVTAGINPGNGKGIELTSVSGIAGIAPNMTAVGDIFVTNAAVGAVGIGNIKCAQNVNLNLGAGFACNAGTVTAGGDLTVNILAGGVNVLGDVKAGGNISCTAAAIGGSDIANLSAVGNIDLTVTPGLVSNVDNVYARGNIDIDTGGGVAVGIGKVWAGGNVGSLDDRMTLSAVYTGVGSVNDLSGGIRAGGSVYIGPTAWCDITGPIQANGNVDITNTFDWWLFAFTCDGIWAGQSIKLVKSASLENYWEVGLINDGSEDGIRYGTTADLTCGTVASSMMAIGNFTGGHSGGNGYITYGGSAPTKSGSGTIYSKGERPQSVASPGIGSPTVDLGTLPTLPSNPDFPGTLVPFTDNPYDSNDSYDKLKQTPPKVDSKVLLELAGLEAPVTPLDPNWAYFEEQAKMDDLELAKTKPAWVTLAPHVLTDNGPYDQDPTLGKITWNWTTGSKYINRLETIYVGESYTGNPSGFVDLKITGLDMAGADIPADVIATVVCRGDIYMDITESTQNMKTGQTLNLVAGHDITRNVTADVAFGNAEKTFLHFYAGHDVILVHFKLTFGEKRAFTGSVTAGNQFFWGQVAFLENTTARWTRWALDPEAFAPKVKVISWEEI